MSTGTEQKYRLKWVVRLADVDQRAWDRLAVPLKTPLLEWDWLHQMEASGSIAPENGWLPRHLTVWSGPDLVAAAPLYIKAHSLGEFVFDHAWAELSDRLGHAYYPKMVGMSPVTPVVGYRFLIAPGENESVVTRRMVEEIDRFCLANGLSGCSFLFVDPEWQPLVEANGFAAWKHQSYVWENPGFTSFDEYLALFKSNQRRNIRRERRSIEANGIRMKIFVGDEIPDHFFPLMYRFYERTNDQYGPWGCKYLTPAFFRGLRDVYRHRLMFTAFERGEDSNPIGMSLFLTKGDLLFGRYWGSFGRIDNLHFNACYYSPIEWAIRRKIERFDPGAGSPHKLRRGFAAVANHSLHRFYDPAMAKILHAHIDGINRMEQEQIDLLNTDLPFARRETSDSR
jgi:uncharacterized protein